MPSAVGRGHARELRLIVAILLEATIRFRVTHGAPATPAARLFLVFPAAAAGRPTAPASLLFEFFFQLGEAALNLVEDADSPADDGRRSA